MTRRYFVIILTLSHLQSFVLSYVHIKIMLLRDLVWDNPDSIVMDQSLLLISHKQWLVLGFLV